MCEEEECPCISPKILAGLPVGLVVCIIAFCYATYLKVVYDWGWFSELYGWIQILLLHVGFGNLVYNYYKAYTTDPGYVDAYWVFDLVVLMVGASWS